MFDQLPHQPEQFLSWTREDLTPYFDDLRARRLTPENLEAFMRDWSRLASMVGEMYARLYVAQTQDTTNPQAEAAFNHFLDGIYQVAEAANYELKQKLLDSGLTLPGMEVPLELLRAEASIYRAENLPLLAEERKLGSQYNKIAGAQTVNWEGQELTLTQLRPAIQYASREQREKAWRMAAQRILQDRTALNELYNKLLHLRLDLAKNAGTGDYRSYVWKERKRLDYTPQDSQQFHAAILETAVPAATRVYEKHRQRLGLDSLRPWDLDLDLYPVPNPPLAGYGSVEALEAAGEVIFSRVDPQLGEYFGELRRAGLLDLPNRKGKGPGAYCITYSVTGRPFIFMNAVGMAEDVRTLLHESGHAFHAFEEMKLPYLQQRDAGLEFAEVASMAMELLAAPYLTKDAGGFYTAEEAARANIQHLERVLIFWPYMAVVDAFQHWVYEHPELAKDPANLDAHWLELWNQYIPGVDWSGLEQEAMTGWHRKLHIYRYPFYYIEYGLAQQGAMQVWKNALQDQAGAVEAYLAGLRLGGTKSLPELYRTAGGKFAFDAGTLGEVVTLAEEKMAMLEQSL